MIGRVRVTLRHRLRAGRRGTESSSANGRTLLDVRDGVPAPLIVQSPVLPTLPVDAAGAVAVERAATAMNGTASHGLVRHPKNDPLHDDATRLLVPERPTTPADDDPPIGTWQGWHVRAGIRPLLITLDVVAAVVGMLLTDGLRPVMVVFAALLLSFYAAAGMYKSRLSISLLDDLPQLVGRLLAALALTMMLQTALRDRVWGQNVDWRLVMTAFGIGVIAFALRGMAYALVRYARSTGRIAHRTLILGAGQVGTYLAETLSQHPEYGLQPIGFLDVDAGGKHTSPELRILGRPENLVEVLLDHKVRNVVVAFGRMREADMVDVIRTCDRMHCEVFVVPRLFELQHVGGDMDTAWGMPLTRLRRATYRTKAWQLKRAMDIAFSGVALALLSPLMLVVSILVRLEGGPGILFRQERVGVDGRNFQLLKFRSLKPVDETESATNWNIAHDDRLGPVGKILRRTSIDELPQLINILRGDMSLVGPRPERPHFVSEFRQEHPHYVARHRVPSGLTGLAQVHGLRGDTSIAERARFDNYYIENWSLWLDVKILLRTAMSVLRAEGA
jgi:exopolysaccharide biosynthesis polyprenyl glycosylphosphotransferase